MILILHKKLCKNENLTSFSHRSKCEIIYEGTLVMSLVGLYYAAVLLFTILSISYIQPKMFPLKLLKIKK